MPGEANAQRQKVSKWLSGAEKQRPVIAKGQWVSFWDDGNVLELDSGGGRMTL